MAPNVIVENSFFHGKLSKRAYLAHAFGKWTLKQLLAYTPLTPPTYWLLKGFDRTLSFIPKSSKLSYKEIKTKEWKGHLFVPKTEASNKIVIYFHGGAFIAGGLGTHSKFVQQLSLKSSAAVFSVAYRQFPEVLFETSVYDCVQAVSEILEMGYLAEDIILAGDSAGGGLAMRVAADMVKAGVKVNGVICLSGWLDFTLQEEDYKRWVRKEAYLPAKRIAQIAKLVVGREPREEDSPVGALCEGYPRLLLICGGSELLRVDSERAFSRCDLLAIDVEFHLFRGGVHAFPVAVDLFPEAQQALALMAKFVAN